MDTHFRTLGIAHLAYAVLILVPAIFAFSMLSGIGFIIADQEIMTILTTVGFFLTGFVTLLAIPGLLAGYGLIHLKSWSNF